MKKFITPSIVVVFVLAGIFAIAGQASKKSYDENIWLENTLMLDGSINGLPIDKLTAEYIASLPRKIQIDQPSATILDSQWLSFDGRVAIIFTGGMKQGTKVLGNER